MKRPRAVAIVQIRSRLLLELEAAAFLRVSVSTLRGWRVSGKGPRYADYGVITYAVEDLEAFRDRHLRISTSDVPREEPGAEASSGPTSQ